MIPRGFAWAGALALISCTANLDVSPVARVSCESTSQCPTNQVCKTNIGRCVDENNNDDTPPQMMNDVLTPSRGAFGTEFTLTFDVDEPLVQDPSVTVEMGVMGASPLAFTVDETATDRERRHYRFTFPALVATPGTGTVNVGLIDLLGNETVLGAGTFDLDFDPPQPVDWVFSHMDNKTEATAGDAFSFTATTELGAAFVSARVLEPDGTPFAAATATATATATVTDNTITQVADITGTLTLPGAMALMGVSGVVVEVLVEDDVNNVSVPNQSRSPTLTVDIDAPNPTSLVIEGNDPTTQRVVRVSLTAPADTIEVRFGGDVEDPVGWVPFAASKTVTLFDSVATLTVSADFRDRAHNVGGPASDTVEYAPLMPDTSPPAILYPPAGERIWLLRNELDPFTGDALRRIEWTPRAGATSYTVEIFSDATRMVSLGSATVSALTTRIAFADLPANSMNGLMVPDQAVPYYFSVWADNTTMGQTSDGQFEGMDENVYVHCPFGATCATGEVGNTQTPMQSISEALALAELKGMIAVLVAARENPMMMADFDTYDEVIEMVPGVDLLGGYDTSFGMRDFVGNETIIAHNATQLVSAVGIDSVSSGGETTTLQGFTLQGGTAAINVTVSVEVSDDTLEIKDCTILGGLAPPMGVNLETDVPLFIGNSPVASATPGDGPLIENCVITGSEATSQSYGILMEGSSPSLLGNAITSGRAREFLTDTGETNGIYARDSTPLIRGNTVQAGDAGRYSRALILVRSDAIVDGNSLVGGTIPLPTFWTNLQPRSHGIFAMSTNLVVITNNLIHAGEVPFIPGFTPPYGFRSMGVELFGTTAVITNNTVLGGRGGPMSPRYGIFMWDDFDNVDSFAAVTNNVIHVSGSNECVFGSPADSSSVMSIENNLFATDGSVTPYLDHNGTASNSSALNAMDGSRIDDLPPACVGGACADRRSGGNVFISGTAQSDLFAAPNDVDPLAGDWTLKDYPGYAQMGKDVSSGSGAICGSYDMPYQYNCGDVDVDRSGTTNRTCPTPGSDCFSPGAYERNM